MATSYTCPRCGSWHLAGSPCDPSAALTAFRQPPPSEIQQAADAAESLALVRYHLARSR